MQIAESLPKPSILRRMFSGFDVAPSSPAPPPRTCVTDDLVVIVEDDPNLREILTRVSDGCGYRSLSASSFDEVQALGVQNSSASMVLDLTLAHSDAFDVLRYLAHGGFTGPIVIVSGHAQPLIEYALNFGRQQGLTMAGSLNKPLKIEHFRTMLTGLRAASTRPIEIDFAEVLRLDQLEVHFQPRVSLSHYSMIGFEALVRIRHQREGLLLPGRFIGNLSDSEMASLTARVLAKTLEAWSTLAAKGHILKPSINVRARELVSPALLDLVKLKKPTDHRWPGLVMELTEPKLIDEVEAAKEAVVRLQLHGVQLAVDDFGEVASRKLKSPELQLSEISMSRRFVEGCAAKQDKLAVCEAAVAYAKRYKLRTVAEGIENAADLSALRKLGFELGQGNLLSPAMPLHSLITLLEKRAPLYAPTRAGVART